MGLSLEELEKRATKSRQRTINHLKQNYDLARRLGFSSSEAVILQSHKREVIINLAIERGLVKDSTDSKAT